jgi:hypothetical protein
MLLKELFNMSFISTFEELNKLYESVEPEVQENAAAEETAEELEEGFIGSAVGSFVGTTAANALTEDDDEPEDTDVEIEVEDDEEETAAEEAPRQVILACANCGGLVIKPEAEATVDGDSDLANVGEACQYCEDTAGYEIIGIVAPYEQAEESEEPAQLEEGIFGLSKQQKEQKQDYERQLEATGKKSVSDIAFDLRSIMQGLITDIKIGAKKFGVNKVDTFTTLLAPAAERYKNALKKAASSFKKINAFNDAYYILDKAASAILEQFTDNSTHLNKLQTYNDLLLKLDAVKVDKQVKRAVLDEFAKDLKGHIEDLHSEAAGQSAKELFNA